MPITPIQCFTCGKYISEYSELWKEHLKKYKESNEIEKQNLKFFKKHNLNRYCCRNNLVNSVDILEILKR